MQWLSTFVGQNGEVYIVERRRIKGVFLETLELNDFPLDVQVIGFSSPYLTDALLIFIFFIPFLIDLSFYLNIL